MRKLSGCSYDTCPAVWEDPDWSGEETVVVRGKRVDPETVERELDEVVLRLSPAMIQEAAGKLGR